MAVLPGIGHIMAGISKIKSLTFIDSFPYSANETTYTFNVDVGDAASDKRIIISYTGANSTSTFSSGTADGVALSLVSDGVVSAESQHGNSTAGFVIAHIPSSSGSIPVSFTWSGGQIRSVFGVWVATGMPSNTAKDIINTNGNASESLDVSGGGFALGCAMVNTTASNNAAWTGLTEDYDDDAEVNQSGASISPTNGSSLAVTVTWSTLTGSADPACFVSF